MYRDDLHAALTAGPEALPDWTPEERRRLAGARATCNMQRLTWADLDLEAATTITIRHGKAKRVDVIPLHPQLADKRAGDRAEAPGCGHRNLRR